MSEFVNKNLLEELEAAAAQDSVPTAAPMPVPVAVPATQPVSIFNNPKLLEELEAASEQINVTAPVAVPTTAPTPTTASPIVTDTVTEDETFGVGSLLTSPGSQKSDVIKMKQTPTTENVVIDDRLFLDTIKDSEFVDKRESIKENWNVRNTEGNLIGFSPNKEYLDLADSLWNLEKNRSFPENYNDDDKINWLARRSSQLQNSIYEIFESAARTDDQEFGNKIRNVLGVNPEIDLQDQLDLYHDILLMHEEVRPDSRTATNVALAFAADPFSWLGGLAVLGLKGASKLTGKKAIGNIPLKIIEKRMASNLAKKGYTSSAIKEALETGSTSIISGQVLKQSAKEASKLGMVGSAAVGAGYLTADDVARQLREQNLSDEDIEFDFGRTGKQAALGTVFAPIIKATGAVVPGRSQALKKFASPASQLPVKAELKAGQASTIEAQQAAKVADPKTPTTTTTKGTTPTGGQTTTTLDVDVPVERTQTKGGETTFRGTVEEVVDETVQTGTAPLKRGRVKEGLGNVKKFIATLNSEAGRLLRSDASLANQIEAAARKLNIAPRQLDVDIYRLDQELSKLNKTEGIPDEIINHYIDNGVVPAGVNPLPPKIKEVLDNSRNYISNNMEEINTLLGFEKGSGGVGIQYKDGQMYVSRTYEAIYNPAYRAVLKTFLTDRDKARKIEKSFDSRNPQQKIYDGINAGRDFIREQLHLEKLELTGPRALTSAQKSQLEKSGGKKLDFTNEQLEEVDGLLTNLLNTVTGKDAGGGLESIFTKGTGSRQNLINVLRKRGDVDPRVQQFLGLTSNPRRRITETLIKQNEVIAKVRFLRDIDNYLNQLRKENPDVAEVTMKGLIPFLPQKKLPIKDFMGGKAEENLQNIARQMLGTGQAGQSTLMQGLFSSPRMVSLIDNNINLINNRELSKIWKAIQLTSSWAQATNTITDPPAYMLNMWGDLTNYSLNGYILNPIKTARNAKEATKFFKRAIIDKDPDAVKEFNFLLEEGVIESGLVGENIIRNVGFLTDKSMQGSYKNLQQLSSEVYAGGMTVGSRTYGASAAFTKYVMYKGELQRVQKFFPNMSLEEAKKRAAKTVALVSPTYSRAAPIAREIARTPIIGPYVLFTAEVIRTSKNIPQQALKDIAEGTVRIKRGEKGAINQVNSGVQRLTAFVAGSYGLAQGFQLSNEERGVDSNTYEGIITIAPPFLKDTDLLFLPAIPDGTGVGTSSRKAIENLFRKAISKDEIPSNISAGIVENDRGQVSTRYMTSINWNAYDPTTTFGRTVVKALADVLAGKDVDPDNFANIAERELVRLFGQFLTPKLLMGELLNVINTENAAKGGVYDPLNPGISIENIEIALDGLRGVLEPALFDVLREYKEISLATDPELLNDLAVQSAINAYATPTDMQDFLTFAKNGMRVYNQNVDKSIGMTVYKELSKQTLNSRNFNKFIREIPPQPYTPELEKSILEEYRDTILKQFELAKELGQTMNKIENISYQNAEGENASYGDDEGSRIIMAITDMGRRNVSDRVMQSYIGDIVNPTSEANFGLKEGMFVPENPITRSLESSVYDITKQKFSEDTGDRLNELLIEMREEIGSDFSLQDDDVKDIEIILNTYINNNT